MYFTFRFFLTILISVFLIISCSEKEKVKSVEDSFVSYVSNSPSSIIFGKVVLKDFIANLHYQDLPKLNVLLSKEVATISKGFDLNEPIYFSIDSLFQPNGDPTGMFLFMKVKNKDSLADKLSSLGYLIEPGKEKLNIIGQNISGQIDNQLAILHFSKYASKKTVQQAIEKTKATTNNQIKTNLSKLCALSANIHLEHMQRLLDNQFLDRPASKRDELIALYQNSFITADFQLQQEKLIGNIIFDFNSALKKRLFFDTKAEHNLSNISKNDFVSGIGISLNSLKADLFLTDFYPSLLSTLGGNNLTTQMIFMMLGNRPISNLTNGNIAFAYNNSGFPTCNIELGNKSNEIKKMGTPYLNYLNLGQIRFEGNNLLNTSLTKNKQIEYLSKWKNGFLLVYDSKNDSRIRSINEETKFLEGISSIIFTLNNEGGNIVIKGKKQKEGLLHQIANVYINELKGLINN
jgi:hypothetical protein